MLIRCTAKLLKEMGLAKGDMADIESSSSLLDNWYTHLFFLTRKNLGRRLYEDGFSPDVIKRPLPQPMQLSTLSEPCWYVFYRGADESYDRDGKTMCVSRATGAVLHDEGL